ncbi:MAG TPA: M1 family metallopeptidase [Thermoanaerobaculia bacterium]
MRMMLVLGILVTAAAAEAAQRPLTALTANSGAPRTAEQMAVVFEAADLQLRVDPRRRSIEGNAALTFRAVSDVNRLVVELDRNLRIRGIDVDGVALSPKSWSNPEGRLFIALPRPLAAGAAATVRIRYGGKPHVAKRAPWDGGFVWAKTPGGQPWIATAVQGEGCDLFWPCIDHPAAEPQQMTLHISVPAPLVAAANGVAIGMDEANGWRTYHWRTRQPNTYAIALNIAPYELLSADYKSRFGNTIPLRFYHLPEHAAQARELFAELTPMLDFYERTIGPYPFADEKLGLAETPHLGMEHQTINAYGNAFAKAPEGYDWLLHHELAHEWFGNQMTNADWDDLWLHEGFGSYMQPLYLRELYGERMYHALLHRTRANIRNSAPLVSGKTHAAEDVFRADRGGPGQDVYAKGAHVLHTLRNLIGDEAFFRATRMLVYGTAEPRPGNFTPRYVSSRDFLRFVNEATGRDYGWFFDVYVFNAELPELTTTRDATGVTLAWKTAGDRPFPMPVEVRVGDAVQTLPMSDGRGRVTVAADAAFTVDPQAKVLRREPHVEAYQKFDDARKKGAAK